jgi:REP element-mobilizing transposase RayT
MYDRKHPSENHVVDRRNIGTILFCTVNLKIREPILNNPESMNTLIQVWEEAQAWLVGRYVIMPDHLHFFASPASDIPLLNWIAYWRKQATLAWPDTLKRPRWQLRGWDRQMRTEQQYEEKWIYVQQNPVRAKLVVDSSDWPFQGELFHLKMY